MRGLSAPDGGLGQLLGGGAERLLLRGVVVLAGEPRRPARHRRRPGSRPSPSGAWAGPTCRATRCRTSRRSRPAAHRRPRPAPLPPTMMIAETSTFSSSCAPTTDSSGGSGWGLSDTASPRRLTTCAVTGPCGMIQSHASGGIFTNFDDDFPADRGHRSSSFVGGPAHAAGHQQGGATGGPDTRRTAALDPGQERGRGGPAEPVEPAQRATAQQRPGQHPQPGRRRPSTGRPARRRPCPGRRR